MTRSARSMSTVRVVQLVRRPFLAYADEIGDEVEHYLARLGDVGAIERLNIGTVRQAAVDALTKTERAASSYESRVLRGLGRGGKLRVRYDRLRQTITLSCVCYPEEANKATDAMFDRIDAATADMGEPS